MRALFYLEYLLNRLDENPRAEKIYESNLTQLKLHELPEEERVTREMQEQWCLEKLSDEMHVLHKAFYDSIKLELERAKIASTEIKKREPILAEAEAAFQKIKAQYHAAQSDPVIAQEIQKHKQKAAQLIAREWKKRRNVTPEDFVRVESQEFELVEPV